ncbi:MAG TPA: hypothetical protein VHW65_12855 [Gemmatimonadales bacterium]|jgi:uncharacterized PurR-regulated membrane protein YhhQ (DUF165 family)|nr:hypothetical protein [Gemmatimonadales bacterium]
MRLALGATTLLSAGRVASLEAQITKVQDSYSLWYGPSVVSMNNHAGDLLVIVARWENFFTMQQGPAAITDSQGNNCHQFASGVSSNGLETVVAAWYCYNIKAGFNSVSLSGPKPYGAGVYNQEASLSVYEFSGVDNTADPLQSGQAFSFPDPGIIEYPFGSGILPAASMSAPGLAFFSWQDMNTGGQFDALGSWTAGENTSTPRGPTGIGHMEAYWLNAPAGTATMPAMESWDNARNSTIIMASFRAAGQGGGTQQQPVPVALSVSPTSRSTSAQQGASAASATAAVTLTGDNASTTTWSATKRQNWTTLTTASGTASGNVAWSRNTTGLAVGTYVDTITVTAPGAASGSPSTIYDTLRITAPPVPVTLALSPAARSVTAQQGSAVVGDNASVTLTGDNASTTNWTVAKKKTWTTLNTTSGTGSGTASWSRSISGLAVGTYVDTITVTAPGAANGSPAMVFDTIHVTAAPVPVTLALSPAARSVSVQQGSAATGSNATITLTGDNASTTSWTVSKKQSWTTLTTTSGMGGGSASWTRNTVSLAVGTYVDTITVTAPGAASGSPAMVFDTIHVTAAPVPVTLALSPSASAVTVQQGNAAAGSNATITLTGDNAPSTTWSVAKKKTWTTLTTTSGTGSGTASWTRNTVSLAVGTYVDTIAVTAPGAANGSPAMVFDTIHVTAAPVPVTLALSPSARSITAQQGSIVGGDNATITLTGNNASSTTWTVSKKKSWTTLTTTNGTGSGTASWSRSIAGLAVGTYVDTITVTAPGAANGSPAMVFDTVHVTAAPVPVTLALSATVASVTVQQGNVAAGSSTAIIFTGDNASTTTWTASKKKSWTTLAATNGTGNGTASWTRSTASLAVGTYVDTITVTAPGAANGSPAMVFDTIHVTAAPVPVTLALSATVASVTVQQGTAAAGSSTAIAFTGDNASTTTWTVSKKQNWTVLATTNGTGSGTASWTRNTASLAVGTYVDTITVTATGAVNGSPAMVFDTVHVTANAVPVMLALSPAARSVSLVQGSAAGGDNAAIALTGTGAGAVNWFATSRKSWTTLATTGGTGSGSINWTRNTATLAVGTYVDTITVTAPGAVNGSPATVFDTIHVTAAPVPVVLAVSPAARSTSIDAGSNAPGDNASVRLTGDNAGSTSWTAAHRKSWTVLTRSSGTGSGMLIWNRNASGLAAGVYVDTITVTAVGAVNGAVAIFDTLTVTAVTEETAFGIRPRGKRSRVLTSSSLSNIVLPPMDTATVSDDADSSATWVATTTSTQLQIMTPTGPVNSAVVWTHLPVELSIGLHIDTVHVALQQDASVQAIFVDTMEVVDVPAPDPSVAVDALFGTSALTSDQRALLDRLGNNNGTFDLGDFLAWVDRQRIVLSARLQDRLKGISGVIKP